jgi:hypothetical protein
MASLNAERSRLFLFWSFRSSSFLEADNPTELTVIRSLILLGARRNAGALAHRGDLFWVNSYRCNTCIVTGLRRSLRTARQFSENSRSSDP